LPLPVLNNTQKYQLSIEKNSLQLKFTEEIQEYFDGLDNIGIIISSFAGLQTYSYGYFANNELLTIESNSKKNEKHWSTIKIFIKHIFLFKKDQINVESQK